MLVLDDACAEAGQFYGGQGGAAGAVGPLGQGGWEPIARSPWISGLSWGEGDHLGRGVGGLELRQR